MVVSASMDLLGFRFIIYLSRIILESLNPRIPEFGNFGKLASYNAYRLPDSLSAFEAVIHRDTLHRRSLGQIRREWRRPRQSHSRQRPGQFHRFDITRLDSRADACEWEVTVITPEVVANLIVGSGSRQVLRRCASLHALATESRGRQAAQPVFFPEPAQSAYGTGCERTGVQVSGAPLIIPAQTVPLTRAPRDP